MNQTLLELADDVWEGRASRNAVREYGPGYTEEVDAGIAMVPGFGNSFAIDHGDGLALFDTGPRETARALHAGIRRWSAKPVTHAVYSHGHLDHVCGVGPFDDEAEAAGRGRPVVLAHRNVERRFARYDLTKGYNTVINQRQFRNPRLVWPEGYRLPDLCYDATHELAVGALRMTLTHHRGETDDHTVGFIEDRGILLPGDLFVWCTPNAGNPQKVQRYPAEWAQALRWMASLGARLMLPSHGVPVVGPDRVRRALEETATYLESLLEQTLAVMNAGGTVLEAIHEVRAPDQLADRPYLQPVYDEPEFVVRNIWRLYGGWYDGNPAHLKPAPEPVLARELAELCGGAGVLSGRARLLAEAGDLRLAGHLAQLAVLADPENAQAHEVRADVYRERVGHEPSTMARGVFSWTAAESEAAVAGTTTLTELSGYSGRRQFQR